MTENPGIHVLSDARWLELEPLINEVRPYCEVPHENLRQTIEAIVWWHQNGGNGLGGRRLRPRLRRLPGAHLGHGRPALDPAEAYRRTSRLPAVDLQQLPPRREPLGPSQGMACRCHALQEHRPSLPRRPLPRSHIRLAQGLTGPRLRKIEEGFGENTFSPTLLPYAIRPAFLSARIGRTHRAKRVASSSCR
jgi:hypothetical protein